MITKIFAILDNKALAFMPPFTMRHENEAKRALAELANNPEHQVGKHPGDYQLFEIASFDDINGTITATSPIVNHGLAAQYVKHGSPDENQVNLFPNVPHHGKNSKSSGEVVA